MDALILFYIILVLKKVQWFLGFHFHEKVIFFSVYFLFTLIKRQINQMHAKFQVFQQRINNSYGNESTNTQLFDLRVQI